MRGEWPVCVYSVYVLLSLIDLQNIMDKSCRRSIFVQKDVQVRTVWCC